MTKKNEIENIKSGDIKLDQEGNLQISADLLEEVSGGVSPEDMEDEAINIGCNTGCTVKPK